MSTGPVAEPQYDVVVVGAGINGLGIARDAAARGLRVALVEKDDICSGVSAWSGRLVHGGLRYLEHGEIPLVRESLRERERLFRLAPHLVKPVRLLMPFFEKNKRPSWMVRIGMLGYDVLSFDKATAWHRILSKRAIEERFSGIERRGLSGAAMFTDGQLEYAERLLVELAVDAAANGARIITHTAVVGIPTENGRVTGVDVRDRDGSLRRIPAKFVLNAAGPWVDWVLGNPNGAPAKPNAVRHIGGAKGSHIIVDPFPGAPRDVVYYESQTDQRLVLVIPWMGRYLIGTTDIKFEDDPDDARATEDEVTYLLKEVNALVPGAGLRKEDVLFTYSGVRPLPYRPGVPEWRVPRSHILHDHAKEGRRNLVSAISGKLTTYRQLAEDAVDLAQKALGRKVTRSPTRDLAFPGARAADLREFAAEFARTVRLDKEVAERLVNLYGTRAQEIAALAEQEPGLATRLSDDPALIGAEIAFVVDTEFAKTLTDVMARRTLLAFRPGHGREFQAAVVDLLAERLGWTAEERAAQIEEYDRWLDRLAVPGAPSAVAGVGARANRA